MLTRLRTLIAGSTVGLLALALGTSPCLAQGAAGSVTGIVQDSAGASIPNANVTVHDIDRGTVWTTKTTTAGLYNFPQIPVGNVEVKVEVTGFTTQQHAAFSLTVNQVARVDFTMSVGARTETVEVTATPPVLQSDSTEFSTTLDSKVVSNLPLAARNINELTLLAPGVVSPNIFAFQSAQTTFGTGRPYVNGAREQDNNFTLDGMDVNQADNNDVAYVASPDAVQNFNIITSNAPADYGNYIGGVIVETLKSGTNQFHGDVFWYVRNTSLDANSWQNKANGFLQVQGANGQITTASTLPRQVVQWNNFGGTIGGPIIKDKLFFFADFMGTINNTPRTAETNNVIPTPYLSGDFSQLCTSQGATFTAGVCSNPLFQLYQPSANVSPTARQPFLNNKVPITSSVAQKILSSPEFAQQQQQSYFTSGYIHSWQGDLKIDWHPTLRDTLSGRYSQMYSINEQSNGTNILTPNLTRSYPLKNFVLTWDRQITPNLVNEARIGGQIFPADDQIYTNASGFNPVQEYGLQGAPGDILPAMSFGYGTIGSTNGLEIFHDHTAQISDTLTWMHGRHELHGGFEWYKFIMNDVYTGNSGGAGAFNFNGQYTGSQSFCQIQPDGSKVCPAGNAMADFLLGLPQEVQVGAPLNFHLRNSLFSAFASDTYKITHNVTIIAGLRYELTTARGDKNPRNNVNYDLITGTPQIGTNYNTYTGITNFQPRLGIAWKPSWDQHAVFRAAYDISSYMEGNGVNNMAVINPPNVIMTDIKNGVGTNVPQTTLDQGYSTFSTACTAAELEAFAPNCIAGVQAHATNPNLRPAVDQQWNLAYERQFGGNTVMSIGYAGNKIDHLSDIYLYNQKVLLSNNTVVPGPYMTQLIAHGIGQARYNNSDGVSSFNALEVEMAQHAFHGLNYQLNYTWSKCMTNTLGYFGSYGDEEGIGESQTQATQNFFQNEYDPKADYGRCTTDVANYFGGYVMYDLPFGHGKAFGGSVGPVVNQMIGGWELASDINIHSGFGITPFAGTYMGDANAQSASSLTGSYQPRPNCVAGVNTNMPLQTVQIGSSIGKVNLNPAAVAPTQNYQWGNCQSGSLRGPSLKTADLSIIKQFPIKEATNLAFSAQFINFTNTPIFSVPASWWGQYSSCASCSGLRTTGINGGGSGTTGLFGLLDGSNPGRTIQLSMKLNF